VSRASGIVFDIQHYAVHDGPGIRTLVFLKGCPLSCSWCCNPESQSPLPVLRRFALRCQACRRCAGVCWRGAVRTDGASVFFDRDRCALCRDMPCVAACSSQALVVSGGAMDADTVMTRVVADREFYRNSGGGVTFSGGEPFAQGDFLAGLLARCRGQRIHTAVETCGYVETGMLLAAEPLVDLFLFDLKLAAGERHRLHTGVDNTLILGNLAALAHRSAARVVLRVPLIPGINDDRDNLSAIAAIALGLGLAAIQVLPYHPLGRDKCREVGMPAPPEVAPPHPSAVNDALALFTEQGLLAELA
jgi:pyruvate formate lyase activating enzyme